MSAIKIEIILMDEEEEIEELQLKYSFIGQALLDLFEHWQVHVKSIDIGHKCLTINND